VEIYAHLIGLQSAARAEAYVSGGADYEIQHQLGPKTPRFEITRRRFDMRTMAKLWLGRWGWHFDIALMLFTYGICNIWCCILIDKAVNGHSLPPLAPHLQQMFLFRFFLLTTSHSHVMSIMLAFVLILHVYILTMYGWASLLWSSFHWVALSWLIKHGYKCRWPFFGLLLWV